MGLSGLKRHNDIPYIRAVVVSCALVVIMQLTGCSSAAAKRTAFETLQNVQAQQCERDLSGNCPQREDYDDYQRKRAESTNPE